ncbi:unnamed protein product [Sympodiomycopsis kandeliae]
MGRLPLRPALYLFSFLGILALLNLLRDRVPSSISSSNTNWRKWSTPDTPGWIPPKPSAGFVILCRNAELGELLPTLTALESTFNAHPYTSYPYILLNDEPFNEHFKHKLTTYLSSTRARYGGSHALPLDIQFGLIPQEVWNPPKWINMTRARHRWEKLTRLNIPYADSLSYRNMCRFQSGFFYKHPLVKKLDYYWRVEPSTRFTCNLVPSNGAIPTSWDSHADGRGDFFDPFRWMNANNKLYGWVLSLKEYQHTIRSLWPLTRQWMLSHPEYHSESLSSLPFVLKQDKIGYNLCHYWTNFEIAATSFFNSEAYQSYFNFLDKNGMIYYDRVGDAPIHTIAASWFLNKDQIHQFENIGYFHNPFHACPRGEQYEGKCGCNQFQRFDYDISNYTCQWEWDSMQGINSTQKIIDSNKQLGWGNISNFAVLEGYAHG